MYFIVHAAFVRIKLMMMMMIAYTGNASHNTTSAVSYEKKHLRCRRRAPVHCSEAGCPAACLVVLALPACPRDMDLTRHSICCEAAGCLSQTGRRAQISKASIFWP